MKHNRRDMDGLLVFVAVLMRGRYPRTVPALAAEAGVSRATGYRWVRDIDRAGALPLRREVDPTSVGGRGKLVGVDWSVLRARAAAVPEASAR